MSDLDPRAAGLEPNLEPDGLETQPPGATPSDPSDLDAPAPAPRRTAASLASRILLVVSLVAIVGLAFMTARLQHREASGATLVGLTTGLALGALLVGAFLRAIYLRATHRGGTVRSSRTLLVATALLAVVLVGAASSVRPAPPPDPSAWVRDAAPYVLLAPTRDQAAAAAADGSTADVVIRQVLDHETLVGLVIVSAGSGFDADAELAGFASAVAGAPDRGERLMLHGRSAILARSATQSGLAFVDGTSYVVAVIAADDASARAIADALIAHAP